MFKFNFKKLNFVCKIDVNIGDDGEGHAFLTDPSHNLWRRILVLVTAATSNCKIFRQIEVNIGEK